MLIAAQQGRREIDLSAPGHGVDFGTARAT
jgi:hypothetical protein